MWQLHSLRLKRVAAAHDGCCVSSSHTTSDTRPLLVSENVRHNSRSSNGESNLGAEDSSSYVGGGFGRSGKPFGRKRTLVQLIHSCNDRTFYVSTFFFRRRCTVQVMG